MFSGARNEKKLNLEEVGEQSFVITLNEDMQQKLHGGRDCSSGEAHGGGGDEV